MTDIIIQTVYFAAAILFILGLKHMSSPKTATKGIQWAGIGMLLAVVVSFFLPNVHNLWLILAAIAIGTAVAWIAAKRVAMTAMPEMIAMYNGMGGGAAAAIASIELFRMGSGHYVSIATFIDLANFKVSYKLVCGCSSYISDEHNIYYYFM